LLSSNEIKKLFSDKEFVGNTIRWATSLEFYLDCVLAQYFIRADRQMEALDTLISEVSFGRKIEMLSRLLIRKKVRSRPLAVAGLKRFQRVRNLVAHHWIVSTNQVTKLLEQPELYRMLSGYPNSMQNEFRRTRHYLSHFLIARELRDPNSKHRIKPTDLMFDKIFE
jgi:hypothetical protein